MSRRTNSGSSTPTTPARALHCSKCEPPAEKADCFCKDCKKYFCSECESFFHRSSSRQHHNRVKVSEDVHKHTREADVRSKAALGSSGAALDAEGDVPTTKRSSNDDFARVLVPATTSATDSGSDLKVSVEEALYLLQDFVNSRVAWPDWEVSLPGVLRVLSGAGSEELFAGFQKADGVHKVVSTARLIFDESRLLEHICLTFRILSRNQEAHDMMGLSVIGLLLQALQRHSVDVRIVEHSCGTLSNLGGNPEYVDDIARNNGVTLVQRALLKHDEDARASTMALHALANFGANPALRRDVARASLPHVASALNTHSMDIQLVEHATRLLVNAIGDQEALKTITTQENIYQPAISAAMTTHGGASAAVASHCEILLALWQPPAPGIVSSVTANVAWAFGLPINIPKSAWSKFRKNKGDSDSKGAKKSNKSRRRSKGNEEALRTGV